jgi:hypothetical protein
VISKESRRLILPGASYLVIYRITNGQEEIENYENKMDFYLLLYL